MTSDKQILVLSAATEAELDAATGALSLYLQQMRPSLADVAYTLQQLPTAPYRRVTVVDDLPDAITTLQQLPTNRVFNYHHLSSQQRHPIFLFPGVGDHYLHMGQVLYRTEPVFRQTIETCSTLLLPYLKHTIPELLYPVQVDATPSQMDLRAMLGRGTQTISPEAARLQETAVAQPIVFAVEYALAQLLMSWGIQPQAMMGYSLGEYVCACLSGVLSLPDALTLVARRAQLIQQSPQGRMLTVSAEKTAVQSYLSAQISLAAHNGSTNCVLAGEEKAIQQARTELQAKGIACRLLDTTHAFHSHMLISLADDVTQLVQQFTLHPPQIPYVSNVTGRWITAAEATEPGYWARHMAYSVLCFDGLHVLLTEQTQPLFLEVGPGQSLGSFTKQHPDCNREQVALILPVMPYSYDEKPADTFLLETVGKLWLLGSSPDWTRLQRLQREGQQKVTLPPPFSTPKTPETASVRASRGARRRQRLQGRSQD